MLASQTTKRHILDGNMGDCMNSFSKVVAFLLVAALVMTFSPQKCLAGLHDLVPTSYWEDGSLTNDAGGGLYTQDGWTSSYGLAKIEWDIYNRGAHIEYNYTFAVPEDPGKEISHFIIEVSENFTLEVDYLSGPTPDLGSYEEGSDNPDMPAGFWGIKFDFSDNNTVETISFNTTRLPMWGNFYSKDGYYQPDEAWAVAYNTGLADPDNGAFIPVPDTVVPVPGAVLLGILGLGVAGIKLRKFA